MLDYHGTGQPCPCPPGENWESLAPVGADNKTHHLCARPMRAGRAILKAVLAGCDVVIDHTYHTRACQQAMMGDLPHLPSHRYLRAAEGRTQIPLPRNSPMRCTSQVDDPGGQAHRRRLRRSRPSVCALPPFVTWKPKPSKIISKPESRRSTLPRHDGLHRFVRQRRHRPHTLSNTGAYGESMGFTTVGFGPPNPSCLYGKAEAFRLSAMSPTRNHVRGRCRLRCDSGPFAVESAVNELADRLGIDPFVIRQRNIVHEGDDARLLRGGQHQLRAGPLPAGA